MPKEYVGKGTILTSNRSSRTTVVAGHMGWDIGYREEESECNHDH